MSQSVNKYQQGHEEANKLKVIAPGRIRETFYLVWCNFHLKTMFWGENMILYLYYHLLCNFMSTDVLCHNLEPTISTKSSPCLSEKFSIAFLVSNHVINIFSRKRSERVFQWYITLSKLTPGLKFMPKWIKLPYTLNQPLFPPFP